MTILPTRNDINPSGLQPDELTAVEHFYGKNLIEAATLFFIYPTFYLEDLLFMGGKAFTFYFPALEPYLLSKESKEDAETISALLMILELRLKGDPLPIINCSTHVLRILTYISTHIDKFNVNLEIFGDLLNRTHCLIRKIQKR